MTVGGSQDDVAKCVVYDPVNELVIVGGSTRSSDFGPARSSFGFLYAINLQGDWTWGHYFTNQTNSIREITACSLSSDGQSIITMGTTRDQVFMGVVNGTSGRMEYIYSLQNKKAIRDEERVFY